MGHFGPSVPSLKIRSVSDRTVCRHDVLHREGTKGESEAVFLGARVGREGVEHRHRRLRLQGVRHIHIQRVHGNEYEPGRTLLHALNGWSYVLLRKAVRGSAESHVAVRVRSRHTDAGYDLFSISALARIAGRRGWL